MKPRFPSVNALMLKNHNLTTELLDAVADRLDCRCAIEFLTEVTGGHFYLFGGAVRRLLLGDEICNDIDVMIPNGDDRAINALDRIGVPYRPNSHNHRRYRWNYLEIDMLQPRSFYSGFCTVDEALMFFDLKINALALYIHNGRVLDPFGWFRSGMPADPGINWARWRAMDSSEQIVLAIRLAKVMYENPMLTIAQVDSEMLSTLILPRITASDWSEFRHRFPTGKQAFLRLFHEVVLKRRRHADDVPADKHSPGKTDAA